MEDTGVLLEDVLDRFINVFDLCDIIIAHSIEFDINMIRAEMLRTKKKDCFILNNKKEFCTMKGYTNYCKIPGRGRGKYKWPKLYELHERIYNYTPKNLHNSLVDVIVCLRCYLRIEHKIEIIDTSTTIPDYLAAQRLNHQSF